MDTITLFAIAASLALEALSVAVASRIETRKTELKLQAVRFIF